MFIATSARSRSSLKDSCDLRVASRRDRRRWELFAQSLDLGDWVALEVTGNASAIAGILEPHVARVVVVSPGD